jgi:two-component system, LytTR family, response regulator LytT
MKVLIIEDEMPAAKQLAKLLLKADANISVIETLDSVEASTAWLRVFPMPDAIFMDIQIADGLSFDIFNQVDIKCPVVFTTAFDQYAVKAFRVNALDYLLKPIDEEELSLVLSKLKKENSLQRPHDFFENFAAQFIKPIPAFKLRFLIKQGAALSFVETVEIAYFISEDGLTYLYTHQAKKYCIELSLDELEGQLNPIDFFRINRKMITAVKSIKKISPYFNSRLKLELVPLNPIEVLVARERTADFKIWLGS